ncbi:hypothetical protein [Actinomadura coerulea]|uniref:hypothetical protein n=1 Tax=Actinomadura coerulea TaxID=46159 RepID=UPI00341C9893
MREPLLGLVVEHLLGVAGGQLFEFSAERGDVGVVVLAVEADFQAFTVGAEATAPSTFSPSVRPFTVARRCAGGRPVP